MIPRKDEQMNCIDIYDQLKMYNRYTNDYREKGSSRYKDFHKLSPYEISDILAFSENYKWDGDRQGLVAVLRDYAQKLGCTAATAENIQSLKQGSTVAVMTGHQPSLLGGPLFVFLKIASIISLCRKLNKQSVNTKFVPVFWAATEDHNAAEYTDIEIYDQENDLSSFTYLEKSANIMASARKAVTDEQFEVFFAALPQTEFLPQIKVEIHDACSETLGDSFCRLINRWFGEFGLVIIEPKYLRKLAQKTVCDAIIKHRILVSNMHEDTVEMENKGYPAQLPDADLENTFLFYVHNGIRYRIRYIATAYCIPEINLSFSEAELLAAIRENPGCISPVAGLRPIIQGQVLPACIYIAGGGELAYHYQLRRNFRELGVSIPMLIPRMSGTFITPSIRRLLNKFSIAYSDILSAKVDWEIIEKGLLAANTELNSLFSSYYDVIANATGELGESIRNRGIVNISDIEKEAAKFIERVQRVQQRLSQQSTPLGNNAKKQFFKMYKFLLPKQKYQELSIAGVYFYNLLGKDFFAKICEADVLTNDHKLWIFE